ncbi:HTH La-type RNA-binding domain-containing protein [Trichonephila clavipes]|nr:HTH La-type RNA-binding domain-containing protein [Trichonephila clavipes]
MSPNHIYARRNVENGYAIRSGSLLMDEPMLPHIKNCTEVEARRLLGENEWSTTLDELDAFISILYGRVDIGNNCPKNKLPETISFYNSRKFGVDIADQMVRKYSVEAGTRRWWPIFAFYNIIDLAGINSWILYKVTGNTLLAKEYFQQLIEVLHRAYIHKSPEELLGLLSIKGQTRGENIANAVIECMDKHHIPLDKIVSISTDGAKSKTGVRKGDFSFDSDSDINFSDCSSSSDESDHDSINLQSVRQWCKIDMKNIPPPPPPVLFRGNPGITVNIANNATTRGLLATDHVILNHGQVTWTTPELAPPSPNYHTTPMGGRFSSRQI